MIANIPIMTEIICTAIFFIVDRLSEEMVLKIADFGFAKIVSDYYRARNIKKIPVKWTAVEVLNSKPYTTKSDVVRTKIIRLITNSSIIINCT